jgi:hypothetical protein
MWQCVAANNANRRHSDAGACDHLHAWSGPVSRKAAERSWVSPDVSHVCLLERVVNVLVRSWAKERPAEFVKSLRGEVEGCGILH